ncbi:helix-turn-helix domain-containing protein [Solwaraspora sp. WMMA2080]|uniref:ATP-binding protein n=1 Tax=unclassified Solwaraspora TaxID=2627926 RepID=UPI00248AF68B|nr:MULTISPECIES: helix-turn-helix domain-containing protein [unclassified Solwaraspora]WBB94915.1 helix-turn-helix domain-containing protein [Solwaraspora sp. WMMA2059]WBC21202.1 helix-turn-helix domain-containing protein [Solwaraspora sp. WMMA2080]
MPTGQVQHDQFGDLLRTLRLERRLTQEELAEAAGSSVRSIREMERGRVRSPQRRTVVLLADALRLAGADRDRFVALARAERQPREGGTVPHDGPAVVVPGELPSAVPDLAGRAEILQRLSTLAAEVAAGRPDTSSVVVLHGPPGIGKTSLAVAAGHRLSWAFAGGQLFVDLQGASPDGPLDPAEALAGLLRSLGVPDSRVPVSPAERGGLFRTLTRDRPLLVVLDNAANEAQVRALLPAGRGCLALVTCRRPLAGLAGAVRQPLDLLAPAAGRALLAAIVGADRIAAEPAAADQLVTLCGQLPLAVRIAGNRLASRPQWSVAWLVDLLRDERRRLTVLTAGDLGVRSAFEVSYRQLDPVIARVFRRASLIPGTDFAPALVAVVAGIDEETASTALEELVEAGLLLTLGDRYQFHDLVRLYAKERLDAEEPQTRRTAAHERMIGWLLLRTRQAGVMFEPDAGRADSPFDDDRAAAYWLDRESGNWLAALRDAARCGRHADVVAVARALHWYSDANSHRHPWEEVFSLAVAAARAVGSCRDEAVLLNFLGWAQYFCQDRNLDGLATLDRALDLARRIGDRREQAWALTYTAAVLVRTGRAESAVDHSRRAVGLFREIGYALGEQSAASAQAGSLAALGRFAEAAELHREVLAFHGRGTGLSRTGAAVARAGAMMSLGADLAGMGRLREAADEYARARRVFNRCGATFSEASAVHRYGLVLAALGEADAAAEALRAALALYAALSCPWWEAQTLDALAALADAASDRAAARLLRERALDRCGELDAPQVRALRATLRLELAEP